ncbi:transcriptional regulator [Nocardia sp. NPDC059240]|uniref:transcriptional regulator n=1 Tax=Nocardia sp. NPDC059240 TaxID=3346786 RepID=UPI003697E827
MNIRQRPNSTAAEGRAGAGPPTFATKLAELFAGDTEGPGAGDVNERVRACLARAARAPGAQGSGWLVEVAESAAGFAREGIDLDRVLLGYHEAIHDGLELAVTDSPGADATSAGRAELLLALLRAVTMATTTAYVDEFRFVAREHQTAAQTLVAALLSGHSRSTLARHTGICIAHAYQVVALRIPPAEAELRPVTEMTALRRLRRVQAALGAVLGSRALSLLAASGGIVLVPQDDSAGWGLAGAFAMTSRSLTALSETAGVELTAVVLSGPTARIPDLAVRAHELLERAHALRYPPGLYHPADLGVVVGTDETETTGQDTPA